ncbi:hypothetical protein ACWDWO_18260 [Actinopolymorpha singaporensis]
MSGIAVVFAQSGSFGVVETTYFGIVLIRSLYGSPERAALNERVIAEDVRLLARAVEELRPARTLGRE